MYLYIVNISLIVLFSGSLTPSPETIAACEGSARRRDRRGVIKRDVHRRQRTAACSAANFWCSAGRALPC